MSQLLRSWSRLPRVAQWSVLAIVLIAAYFLAIEPVLNLTGLYTSKADRIAAALRREKELAAPDSEDGRLLAQAARVFGKPLLPGDPAAKPETLYRVVNRILREHLVDDAVVNERAGPVQLRPEQLTALTDGYHTIEKFSLEVAFEADPQTAVAVLADMESSPEVTAIGRVRIEKANTRAGSHDTDPLVRVMLAPEIWVLSVASAGNAGSNSAVGGLP